MSFKLMEFLNFHSAIRIQHKKAFSQTGCVDVVPEKTVCWKIVEKRWPSMQTGVQRFCVGVYFLSLLIFSRTLYPASFYLVVLINEWCIIHEIYWFRSYMIWYNGKILLSFRGSSIFSEFYFRYLLIQSNKIRHLTDRPIFQIKFCKVKCVL